MISTSHKLPRRSFLSGAASVLGVASIGIAPQLTQGRTSEASGRPASTSSVGLELFFWDGARFVKASDAEGACSEANRLRINISEVGSSGPYRTVDVKLPGGLFYVYTGGPHGPNRATFVASRCQSSDLEFVVSHGDSLHVFELERVRLGHYLVAGSDLDISRTHLDIGARPRVLDSLGCPISSRSVLIELVEA